MGVSSSNAEFAHLVQELQAGSDDAAMRLLELYGPHIYRVVRRKLASELRSRFDSADFVQAVWASFFAHVDRIADFQSPERLVAYISGMAAKKVIDEVRRGLIYKRQNVRFEVRMHASDDSTELAQTLAGTDPTPSQEAIANEQKQILLVDQPSHYRRIIEMRVEGRTFIEIAEALGVNERTVRRVIDKLSKQMQQCHPS